MRMTSGFLPDAGVHALRSPCRTATRQHGCHGWGMATSSGVPAAVRLSTAGERTPGRADSTGA